MLPADALHVGRIRERRWPTSLLVYASFSGVIFLAQGSQPQLGSDHLSYIQLADSILADCTNGDYWREANSVRSFGVMLAYLHSWTGSHVLSMKIVLAAFSVLYLFAAEAFFSLFSASRWQAMLFALLSAFAVSFGVASWGVTDSTALLPRTLVAPILMWALWLWFRFDERPWRYLAFPLLVTGSLLHLSTFYLIFVLVLVEVWDFLVLRRARMDAQLAAFAAALVASGVLLLGLEYVGLSSKMIGVQIPELLRSVGIKASNLEFAGHAGCHKPAAAALETPVVRRPHYSRALRAAGIGHPHAASARIAAAGVMPPVMTPKEAWDIELSLRPWRNMPLPLVNVADIFSSSALILALAIVGMIRVRAHGGSRTDRLMMAFFFAVPVLAFGPQTLLWFLRSRTNVYPANIEEVRALGLIVVPALYFILRLFREQAEAGGSHARVKAGAIVVAVVALPLFMKGLPQWVREAIFSTMVAVHVVDASSDSSVANARTALGLSAAAAPFYYGTQGVRDWLTTHAPRGSRVLTARDDMILLRNMAIIGPRQVGATTYYATPQMAELFLRLSRAIASKDTQEVLELARENAADYAVVPWHVAGAAFSDEDFSVLATRHG